MGPPISSIFQRPCFAQQWRLCLLACLLAYINSITRMQCARGPNYHVREPATQPCQHARDVIIWSFTKISQNYGFRRPCFAQQWRLCLLACLLAYINSITQILNNPTLYKKSLRLLCRHKVGFCMQRQVFVFSTLPLAFCQLHIIGDDFFILDYHLNRIP